MNFFLSDCVNSRLLWLRDCYDRMRSYLYRRFFNTCFNNYDNKKSFRHSVQEFQCNFLFWKGFEKAELFLIVEWQDLLSPRAEFRFTNSNFCWDRCTGLTTTGAEFYLCPFGIQEQCDALAVSAETSEHVYFAVKQNKHRRPVIKNRRFCVLMTSLLYTTCPNDAMDDTISTRGRKIFWRSLAYFFEATEFLYQSAHFFA